MREPASPGRGCSSVRSKGEWIRIGVDTGGTFTDLVVIGSHIPPRAMKVPSTPSEPAKAVLAGLARMGLLSGEDSVIHGTTVATNAFLERRHGKAALITTQGFEDVLVLGRQARTELYRLDPPSRPEWIPRALRLGVAERVSPRGEVLQRLDPRGLAGVRRRLRRAGVDAVAICLLHAYANPRHEKLVRRTLRREGWHVSASHQVAGEFREYERTCTTVANAVLAAPMRRYLETLRRRLGGRRLRVMGSSGGWMSAQGAARLPVRTLLSGPAGGVCAAALLGRRRGSPRLITLDMGGTSTDLAVCEGEVPRRSRAELGGMSLMMPALEIHSLGAGGGSIARCDAGGALRVGPSSAGSDPGPACYGRGGTAPTLTDANLLLGRLPPGGLLDGAMPLDAAAARAAVSRLGQALGVSAKQAARGIVRVVESGLENALRSLVAGKGYTLREFTLLVFGGAGGLHACGLARRLGVRRILVPPDPGTFSAMGLALSPCTWESSRTVLLQFSSLAAPRIRSLLRPMVEEGARAVRTQSGLPRSRLRILPEADLRYAGQSHEITLPLSASIARRFHRAHAKAYGYARAGETIELVTLRVRVEGTAPSFDWRRRAAASVSPVPPGFSSPRRMRGNAGLRCLRRTELSGVGPLRGPLLVEEYGATTYVAAGFEVGVGRFGELVIEDQSGADG